MRRTLAFIFLTSAIAALHAEEQSSSPYATAADFAKYAMKLREQALLKVEPQVFVPTSSRPAIQRFAWKTNIVTTVFWIGEQAGGITSRSLSFRGKIRFILRCLTTT